MAGKMYDENAEFVTLDDIRMAKKIADESLLCKRTPLLRDMETFFEGSANYTLCLKLENFQTTGSYKIRGIVNQMKYIPDGYGTKEKVLVTMSAGNYGKAFAYITNKLGFHGLVVMPNTAPENRTEIIKSYGVGVDRGPPSELQGMVDRYCAEQDMLFCHSFDDHRLIAGHAGLGLEIMEDVPDADIVLVGCGGGALLSGIAAAIKLSGKEGCRVYGVEPEGANTMFRSLKADKPVGMKVKTVAAGLAPPYAGPNSFKHVKRYTEGILLVTDDEILRSMFALYNRGLVVESSGAAAFAALCHGKVPDVEGKKVVVVITGGNISPQELAIHAQNISA